jgi:uncharacterized membrane protein
MSREPTLILALLCLFVVVSETLVRSTGLRHAGTALVVILVTALAANLGIVPAGSSEAAPVPLYDAIFRYLAPLAIFWLLLLVNLRDVLRAGLPIVTLFLIGSAGITVAAFVAARMLPLDALGPSYRVLGGMFVGTYTGGSINFNAVGLSYGIMREGALYAGAIAVDNVVTTLWMVATLALPRLLAPLWPARVRAAAAEPHDITGVADDTETVHARDVAILGALGLAALFVSDWLHGLTGVPSILWLTTIALVIAQLPFTGTLRGARLLGMFAVYLFLAVIGAFCDVRQLIAIGSLAPLLLGLAGTLVLIHGAVTFGAARLLRIDLDVAAVASQANVGGATTALAVARSIGRPDLVLPAVLIGSLGTGLGTFPAMSRTIRVAHSPDSDDAFMFYALAENLIDTGDLEFVHELQDIETLNRRALNGELEVTAVSIHAYAYIADRYALLPHGASMGEGYGPRSSRASRSGRATCAAADRHPRRDDVGVPGAAHVPCPMSSTVTVPFDEIIDLRAAGKRGRGADHPRGPAHVRRMPACTWSDLGEWWAERDGRAAAAAGRQRHP